MGGLIDTAGYLKLLDGHYYVAFAADLGNKIQNLSWWTPSEWRHIVSALNLSLESSRAQEISRGNQ